MILELGAQRSSAKRYCLYAAIALCVLAGIFYWITSPVKQPGGNFNLAASGVSTAAQLKREGRIRSGLFFSLYLRARGWDDRLYAGDHKLQGALTPFAIAGLLHSGSALDNELVVTFPEGFTTAQIAAKLAAGGVVGQQEFLATLEKYRSEIEQFFGPLPATAAIEGVLFPDTYRFYRSSTPEQVMRKMLDNFKSRVVPLVQQHPSQQLTNILEVVTLASIVEKELATSEDRAMGADVFLRRMKSGMRLQSDVTVLYGAHSDAESPSAQDLALDTPYNTYIRDGLPVGPINNPGLDSIRAVLQPKQNPYLYFIAAPDGKVYWAKTLDEHNALVQQYLR